MAFCFGILYIKGMYTLIIMKKDSTERSPRTIHLSVFVIGLMSLFFFGLPVAGYVLFNKVVAPQQYESSLTETTENKEELLEQLTDAEAELTVLRIETDKLKTILADERKHRAESEARATIAETAKVATGQQIASTETELRTLQRKVAFYEDLLKPKTEQERLQCYNMSATYSKGKLRYAVSFLKNDNKDKATLGVKARMRVIPAVQTAQDGEADKPAAEYPVLSTRSFSLTKAYTLSGNLNTTVDENMMHILDIEVKDTQNNLVAKCWQSI